MPSQVPWEKMNQVLLQCGSTHEAHRFNINALVQLQSVIPFDQGRLYFLNDNLEVYDEFLLGVDKQITKAYHEYYSKIENGQFSATRRLRSHHVKYPTVCNWAEYGGDEFYTEHVRPQGLRYSTGFCLRDLLGAPKALFCLDRTSRANYSQTELETLYYLNAHLENFYRNFYAQSPDAQVSAGIRLEQDLPLTARETEISQLLSRGASPESIAAKLCISRTTVYKHITHIHAKLHVSSRQELLVKLLCM